MVRIRESVSGVQIGKTYGKWTVLGKPFSRGQKRWHAVVECECGCIRAVCCKSLKRGDSRQCIRCNVLTASLTHGDTRNPGSPHKIWVHIRQRCLNPRDKNFYRYGGRGIRICDEWMEYENFRDWAMLNGFKPGLTIDRIDNDGNYEPDNCEWVTRSENSRRMQRSAKLARKQVAVFGDF